MGTATLTIDLNALRKNWRRLNAMSSTETGAVVKADAYGLGAARVAQTLADEGARSFFVAVAEEGAAVREALGDGPTVYVFSGHMKDDDSLIAKYNLTPLINSIDQLLRHAELMKNHPFGIQLDTGMNRLGMEPSEWQAVRDIAMRLGPRLIMSHLACADEPNHPMNGQQLEIFEKMTAGLSVPRSLSATGGILLGEEYHFDLTRPGIGLYGGLPFSDADPVVSIDIPVIQIRDVETGESVGYANSWRAPTPRKIATVSAGYADGILRAMGPKTSLYADEVKCPIVGRISMDLIGVDVSEAEQPPTSLALLNSAQKIDHLARNAGSIGYEILTSLGARYDRRYDEV